MSMPPARSDENAICVPSGDHAGSVSTKTSSVSRSGVPPIGMVQMSPSAANAMRLPSGEATGWMIPFTGCGAVESKSRFLRVYAARRHAERRRELDRRPRAPSRANGA